MSELANQGDQAPEAQSWRFRTTQWTKVIQAKGRSDSARAALSELCEHYYEPIEYFIVQRMGPDQGRDLAHAFFARLLANPSLDNASPRVTRFRSFLLGAVKHFLSDQRDYQLAQKRGGNQEHVSLDASSTTSPGLEVPDPQSLKAERSYDRRWATTLLNRSLNHLQLDFATDGKELQFEVLKHWLPGSSALDRGAALEQLNLSEGAFKVAVHRLRKRFKETLRAEVAQTVADPQSVREEVRYLIEVLAD